jgi:hypothetical protein
MRSDGIAAMPECRMPVMGKASAPLLSVVCAAMAGGGRT